MIIAITGGIGSGKSKVMKIIRELGGQILSADKINAELLCEKKYVDKLAEVFPEAVEDGVINKKKLGKIVFYNNDELEKLNNIAHPAIYEEIKSRIEKLDTTKNVFVEVPLLIETKQYGGYFDKIWLVKASPELCLKRIVMRDLVNEDYAKKIMSNQASDKLREEYCTDIIENDGTYDSLYERVSQLYKETYQTVL